MKKILLFMGVVALGSTAMAQTQVGQGDFIIDPYIGVPNWANSTMYNDLNFTDDSGVTDYKVNGGQISYGGRIEYLLSDDFGIGADVNYEVSGFNYNDTRSVYDESTMTYVDQKYNYDYKAKKLRAMVRLDYHFVQNERVDAYTAFGAGYKSINRVTESTDPEYNDEDVDGLIGGNGAIFPISLRLALGTRIYFTNNIGAHIELGLFGGSIIQFGVSVKLPTY
ncbi:MAG: outer membrane beta-barrel protein [Crocinitomicaceae bacterium]|nr:outer membrane beta-barrel protein [Crocinitomicaceae bacterium]